MNEQVHSLENIYPLALTPGNSRELIGATRKFELLFLNNPNSFNIDYDDFLIKCHAIDQPAPRVRSLCRILSVCVKIFSNSLNHYQKENLVLLARNWVQSHPQTAIICYCSKIMMVLKSEFRENFLDFRDFIIYQQSNHSKGVQSVIRNYLA
ncbi:MAG: hypothetical protein OXE55_06735 [Flavobacteriaceae bacterium]|nr:hypothetical protein [Flavobacteriaceae bacterium]MCY4254294.1 hypothetical protein [Flavobacteriaceae bacterium]